jgi:hypothetical protein
VTLIGADWLLMSVRVCAALVTFCATFPNARLVGATVALAIPTPLSLMESLFEALLLSITCSVVVRVPRPDGVNRTLISTSVAGHGTAARGRRCGTRTPAFHSSRA